MQRVHSRFLFGLLVAAGFGRVAVLAASSDDNTAVAALGADDECAANGTDASCALNAMQLRGAATATPCPELTGDARWTAEPCGNESELGWAPPPHPGTHRFMATSTQYGTNPHTACLLDSAAVVAGTEYLAVASAESMQDGCCVCNNNGGGGHTASMGCGDCARGRFIRRLPRGFHIWTHLDEEIFHKEYKLVVIDICPKGDNKLWCPAKAGHTNTFGVHNHFDFATPPPKFDNFYFEFTPEECSPEIKHRFAQLSHCPNHKYK